METKISESEELVDILNPLSGEPFAVPPVQSKAIVLFSLAILVCFLIAYSAICQAENRKLYDIQRSILFYAGAQPHMPKLSQFARSLHVRTVDLMSPGAGKLVFQLTGSHSIVSPSLVTVNNDGIRMVTHPYAISREFLYAQKGKSPYALAKIALFLMAALNALALRRGRPHCSQDTSLRLAFSRLVLLQDCAGIVSSAVQSCQP